MTDMRTIGSDAVRKTLILLLAGMICRIIYLIQFSESPVFSWPTGTDVEEYYDWARRILAGEFLWHEVHIHAPLYPYFLAFLLFFSHFDYMIARLLQESIGLAAFIPLFFSLSKISEGQCGSSFIKWGFIALCSAYPPLIYYQAEFVSEALMLPLLCIVLFMLYRAEEDIQDFQRSFTYSKAFTFAGAGFLCGLASICHPLSVFFPFAEFVYLSCRGLSRKERMSMKYAWSAVIFAVSAAILPLAVSAYNSYQSGGLVFIQKNSGFNFWLGNNRDSTGGCYLRPGPEWESVHRSAEAAAAKEEISKDLYFLKDSCSYILHNPLGEIGKLIEKAVMTVNFRELPSGDVFNITYYTPFMRNYGLTGLLFVFALCGLTAVFLRGNREDLFKYRHFIILIIVFWILQIIFVTSGRYRLAMYPGLFVMALYGAKELYFNLKNSAVMFKLLPVFFIACAIVCIPSPRRDMKMQEAEASLVFAEAYIKAGNYKAALPEIESALKFYKNWGRPYEMLGNIHAKSGDYKTAMDCYRKGMEADPYTWNSPMNLAIEYDRIGQKKEAEKFFDLAMKIAGPKESLLLYNIADFQYKNGNISQALENLNSALYLKPYSSEALNLKGVIKLKMKEYPEAAMLFRKALVFEPQNPEGVKINLAVAEALSGHEADARRIVEDILKNNPDSAPAKAMLQKLR